MASDHYISAVTDGTNSTSESEQMYLITIAMAAEDGHEGPVPVPHLAEALEVSRVSANEMVKKLAERGLVAYTPYKGAVLTPQGEGIARTVLRRRRLWSLFLADHLGLTPAAADAVACEFEHITPGEVAEQLSHFLGDPAVGPQGKPIPAVEAETPSEARLHALSDSLVGRTVQIVRIEGDGVSRAFLESQGIVSGSAATVMALSDDGGCLLVTGGSHVHLSGALAQLVTVAG